MFASLVRVVAFCVFWTASFSAHGQETVRFILVAHAQDTDPFWATIREGADAAAADAEVELEYRAPASFDLRAMAALVEQAVDDAPAGLIVSLPNAEALAVPLKKATEAGIPVITINSGFDESASLGALLHVGQSEYEAGRVAGEAMRELGGVDALCLNHEPGNVALDLRCKGFIDGFGGSVQVLPVPADPRQASQAIGDALSANPRIDVVLALSASIAGEPAIAQAKSLAPARQIRVGTFDITEPVLTAVADGYASFAMDQQPFLQGYLPVQYLALHHRRGLLPVSNVSTGPRLVLAADAARRLGREAPKGPEATPAAGATVRGGAEPGGG